LSQTPRRRRTHRRACRRCERRPIRLCRRERRRRPRCNRRRHPRLHTRRANIRIILTLVIQRSTPIYPTFVSRICLRTSFRSFADVQVVGTAPVDLAVEAYMVTAGLLVLSACVGVGGRYGGRRVVESSGEHAL
jgi:hypothetical protein